MPFLEEEVEKKPLAKILRDACRLASPIQHVLLVRVSYALSHELRESKSNGEPGRFRGTLFVCVSVQYESQEIERKKKLPWATQGSVGRGDERRVSNSKLTHLAMQIWWPTRDGKHKSKR
jgi:hypothetical protein